MRIYQSNHYIDESLSEQPINRKEFFNYIKELENQNVDNDFEKGKLFSKIGGLYRIYGNLNKSEKFLNSSLELLNEEKNKLQYWVAKIRLAQTYQKQKRIKGSLFLFNKIQKECLKDKKLNTLIDFIYQHKAKVYFDIEDYKKALYYFKKALKIREVKKDNELISSTKFAIEITLLKIK